MLFISDLSENCVTNNRVKFVQIALYCLSGTTGLGKPLINGEKKNNPRCVKPNCWIKIHWL
jgi:hypothetical protein